MIEIFAKTLRPLVAKIATFDGKNSMGEPIKTETSEEFLGAIFASSARDFSLSGDVSGVAYSHKMYSKKHFAKNDTIIDDAKKYEVVGCVEVRDLAGKIDHYKTFLTEYE